MRFFDSHVHVDHLRDEAQQHAMIEAARAAGVLRMVAVGGCPDSNRAALELASRWPNTVRAAIGWDRRNTGRNHEDVANLLAAHEGSIVAIGEIGLDFHHDQATAAEQRVLFSSLLGLALRHRLPVIVHSRDAELDTLQLLRAHVRAWRGPADRVGVVHCFTGSQKFAAALLEMGFFISFSGILTFANAAALREVAKSVPLDRTLIETDTPWLAPSPYRGRINEPARVPWVAQALAEVHGIALEELAEITWTNANHLFGWPEG